MKYLLLAFASCAGMAAMAQTDIRNLNPGHKDGVRFMPDLVKADPNTAGVYYFPKATNTRKDTTWKWVIYRADAVNDIPTTDTFITINDYRITPDGKIAVVGQLEDHTVTGYNTDANGISYSVWQYSAVGSAPAMTTGPVLLNTTYRQYRFDPAGYLGVIDLGNNRYYYRPDGSSTLGIDPTLPATGILSPIYPGNNALYCIAKDVRDANTYTLYQGTGGGPLMANNTYRNMQSLVHLQTGKFLVKNNDHYAVYDPDAQKPSTWFKDYRRVGGDSILLMDDKKAWFFVDDDMDTVRLCVDPTKEVGQLYYCPGSTPALVIRYSTNDSLSLCAFTSCTSGPPIKIGIGKADMLMPLFRTDDSLYYLVCTTGTRSFKVNGAKIANGNFTGKVKQVLTFASDTVPSTIALVPFAANPPRRFLLTAGYASGLHSAISLSFAHGSGTPTAVTFTRHDKAYQLFMPGDRFLCSSKDLRTWTAWDVITGGSVSIYEDIPPMQIDRFYAAPCSGPIFYYTYVVDNTLTMGRYDATPRHRERPVNNRTPSRTTPAQTNPAQKTPTQTTNKHRNAKQ